MKNFEPHVYSYTEKNTGVKVVKAIAVYNGKIVSAFAKCDPDDTFNLELGKKIAIKRLEIKITQKRAADKLAYTKRCKTELEFIKRDYRHIQKSMERAEIAILDRRVEIKHLEDELAELLAATN